MKFDEIFPYEIIDGREKKLRGFWNREADSPRSILQVHNGKEFPVRQIEDDETVVTNAINQMISSRDLSDDYLPWFGPDFGTISTAVYWGGEEVYPEDGCAYINPIIFDIDDVERMPDPVDAALKDVRRAKVLRDKVRERIESDRFWVRSVDFQGPLSTVGLIWEQTDLFCAMSTDPDLVHKVMRKVTDHLINMANALKSEVGPQCGPTWPYVWLPDDIGFGFTEDLMPLMSPNLYKEFGAPYLKQLADAVGGAFIHCCGEFEHHLPVLKESGANILGFDYCEPHTRTEAIYDTFGPDLVYHVGISPQGEKLWGDTAGFIENHLSKVAAKDMRFYFCVDTDFVDASERIDVVKRKMID